jgi:NADPH-dependent 2,4-dienoyl-CoA reductase/sulfur reductase-like enzyme
MKLQELQTGILIIGAGPAGLAAASAALNSGKQILITDDNPAPGGQIWRGGPKKCRIHAQPFSGIVVRMR